MAIDTVVQKFALGDEPPNAVAWKNISFAQRLNALESIRQEFHQFRYGAEPRLQRVFTITGQTQS